MAWLHAGSVYIGDAFQNCRVHWCVCDIGIYKPFGPYAGRTPSEAALGPAHGGGVRPAGCGCPAAGGAPKSTIKIVLNHNELAHSGIAMFLAALSDASCNAPYGSHCTWSGCGSTAPQYTQIPASLDFDCWGPYGPRLKTSLLD